MLHTPSSSGGVRLRRQNLSQSSGTLSSEPAPPPSTQSTRKHCKETSDAATNMVVAQSWAQRHRWIVYAVASGSCAACNGVFAKLTTTELTAQLAHVLAHVVPDATQYEKALEVMLRTTFFILNLTFNAIPITKALGELYLSCLYDAPTNQSTTTREYRLIRQFRNNLAATIVNTSTNFLLTALLGRVVFDERLPPLWWAGAALLVAGNVIIGRKRDGHDSVGEVGADSCGEGAVAARRGQGRDERGEQEGLLGAGEAEGERNDDGHGHGEPAVTMGTKNDRGQNDTTVAAGSSRRRGE